MTLAGLHVRIRLSKMSRYKFKRLSDTRLKPHWAKAQSAARKTYLNVPNTFPHHRSYFRCKHCLPMLISGRKSFETELSLRGTGAEARTLPMLQPRWKRTPATGDLGRFPPLPRSDLPENATFYELLNFVFCQTSFRHKNCTAIFFLHFFLPRLQTDYLQKQVLHHFRKSPERKPGNFFSKTTKMHIC